MSKFISQFHSVGNISFMGMRDAAMSLLPTDRTESDKLYNDLKRGKGILDDEPHLNMYLKSFGKMHKAKLDTAYNCLPETSSIFTKELEIYDWGCGQGIATICLLDFLKSKNIDYELLQINLVEPSVPATERAKEVIACFDKNIKVNIINKVFDDLEEDDFNCSDVEKIHLFSNILDVETFDLAQFIHLFQNLFSGANYFICVGPYYSNDRRVDEFVAATEPDDIYATFNKGRGMWKGDWTISLRVFFKQFVKVEDVQDIRNRIEELHKKDQFFAGYILDSVAEEYTNTDIETETESLYRSLSVFDVKSNKSLEVPKDCNSKLAVLANIVSRGLPTKAPIFVENIFADVFDISSKPVEDGTLYYKSKHKLNKTNINEALHIIEPGFDADNYNGDMLESQFEKDFVMKYLKDTDSQYLIQILEPQRPLSSIVNIPNRQFSKDQRVDFAIEIPYGESSRTGFIIEIDGAPYHSNFFHKLRDEKRDLATQRSGMETWRMTNLNDNSFLKSWEQEVSLNKYLSTIKRNSKKTIDGEWKNTLQIVLSPLAIARVERIILQAMMSHALDLNAQKWDILIIERDVPCASIAIELLKMSFQKMSELDGTNDKLPQINFSIVSTDNFADSKLHLGKVVEQRIPKQKYDLCIDIAILLRDNIDALPLNVNAETIYLIRSSHYQKRERTICSAENIVYPPIVIKDNTGSYISINEREEALTFFLQNIFRKSSFRHGQLPILNRSLSDKTTIGLLPTGGGKSLTYQLSSMLQPGITIVVDPLVSLMEDQIKGLLGIRIDTCACVHAKNDVREKDKKLNLLQNGSLQFMLLSPERYMMESFRDSLIAMTEKNHIYFAYGVIDEVHCVSEWGHDFRTSYLHLGRNMINYMRTKSGKDLPIIGLTATASFDVLADVERELTLGGSLTIDSETIVRPENDSRPELNYRIIKVESDFESLSDDNNPYVLKAENEKELKNIVANSKIRKMFQLLKEIPTDIQTLNNSEIKESCHIDNFIPYSFYEADDNNKYNNAGIVFCPHAHGIFGVEDNIWGTQIGISTEIIAEFKDTMKVGTFIGGSSPGGAMTDFIDNKLNLMVATKAFGMGIDKSNIRFTINFNHPSSIESYVQEAGRGGRDKKHAISYILYDQTEYIYLTVDKINDLRATVKNILNTDPDWLESYNKKFILGHNFISFCRSNNCSEEVANLLLSLCKERGFVENVDKDIVLWFHNNSFRGLYKEKVILWEMTDRILNVKPTHLQKVQRLLIEVTGNTDLVLRLDLKKNAIKILSNDNPNNQYGYIFLDSLSPSFKYVTFDLPTCQSISESLIDILKKYEDHSAQGLIRPIEGINNITEGIYSAMAKADSDGYAYITVSWVNELQQNFDLYEQLIKDEVEKISQETGWNHIDEDRFGKLKLKEVGDFDELIAQISKCSNDKMWLRYHNTNDIYGRLKKVFCQKRDKDDTDKAIYRMCCVGLVEDVTIDYLSETYELKIHKRTNEEYKQNMLEFFSKYYSLEQATKKVNEIHNQKGRNYIDKCLGYLTEFVYKNLEKKRFRAIEDMRIACEEGIKQREVNHNDEWLKDFIHLYFNSKYARRDYEFEGMCYSLSKDTDEDGRDDFDVVLKYIDIIYKDSSGSEIDNAKHLYGATLLCLRAHHENAALMLLLTYCIAFLGAGPNETLRANALNGYIEGFISMYEKDGSKTWDYLKKYNELLALKGKEDFVIDELVNKGMEKMMLFIHESKFDKFANRYLQDLGNEDIDDFFKYN